MSESLEKKFGPAGTIVSAVILILSIVADILGIFEKHKTIVEIVMAVAAIALFAFAVVLFRLFKKQSEINEEYEELKSENTELRKTVEEQKVTNDLLTQCRASLKEEKQRTKILETLVCDGKQFLDNKATIVFDIPGEKYKLSFEKRYLILSDATKWYEGQFYSNVSLENAKKSQEYYKEHEVKWDTLKTAAELKYKNPDDNDFSEMIQVSVLLVAEGNNYKKFHIQYKTKNDYKLNIQKGAEIVLTYSYEVPVQLWGSYLNRSISYWGEPATVIIKCRDRTKIREEYFEVFETRSIDGEKVLCNSVKRHKEYQAGFQEMTFTLPAKGPAHYSIYWNAEAIFGIEGINTNMTADHSQLTDY